MTQPYGPGVNGLYITHVEVRPFVSPDEKLRAFATIALNDTFLVRDLKVIVKREGGGLMVAMPSRRGLGDTGFYDVAHPKNQAMRNHIERAVLQEYCKIATVYESTTTTTTR